MLLLDTSKITWHTRLWEYHRQNAVILVSIHKLRILIEINLVSTQKLRVMQNSIQLVNNIFIFYHEQNFHWKNTILSPWLQNVRVISKNISLSFLTVLIFKNNANSNGFQITLDTSKIVATNEIIWLVLLLFLKQAYKATRLNFPWF